MAGARGHRRLRRLRPPAAARRGNRLRRRSCGWAARWRRGQTGARYRAAVGRAPTAPCRSRRSSADGQLRAAAERTAPAADIYSVTPSSGRRRGCLCAGRQHPPGRYGSGVPRAPGRSGGIRQPAGGHRALQKRCANMPRRLARPAPVRAAPHSRGSSRVAAARSCASPRAKRS